MPSSPEEMAASMIANMPEKTGKPLEDWMAIVAKSGLDKHGKIVAMLKADHAMTHGFANLVAAKSLASDEPSPQEAVCPDPALCLADNFVVVLYQRQNRIGRLRSTLVVDHHVFGGQSSKVLTRKALNNRQADVLVGGGTTTTDNIARLRTD